MYLIAQTSPTELTEVLLVPSICFVLGLGLWYAGLHFENRTEKAWVKWLALIPIVIGLVIGLQLTMQATDYTYQRILGTKKLIYSHYLALALPLIAIFTVVAWHLYLKRTGAYDQHRY